MEEITTLTLASSASRNRETYQCIDQQDESSSSANPFNQAQDSKQGVHTYYKNQALNNESFS
ncbi:hypothetical protein D9C73_008350 [Collichthys lucidus]|uniref:Uncharacterized protein n=1 Tax=Collichthys lucidus TaxID=240159 RepID=A0A4U5UI63_COLLU|nr:hypothetical protein D9C73_008350 [Collichthys lucidus]